MTLRPLLLATTIVALSLSSIERLAAAPLDALASTHLSTLYASDCDGEGCSARGVAPRWYFELAADQINDTLDIFDIRQQLIESDDMTVGDYRGGHLLLGRRIGRHGYVEAGLWQRAIQFGSEWADIDSWSINGQWQFNEQQGALPRLAVRLGYWQNQADQVSANRPVQIGGIAVDRFNIANPGDEQLQATLIGSWDLSRRLTLSWLAGVGRSSVEFDQLEVGLGDCDYQVNWRPDIDVDAPLYLQSSDPAICTPTIYDDRGLGSDLGLRYRSQFYHVGTNVDWESGRWRLRGGMLWSRYQREDIDQQIVDLGKRAQKSTLTVVAEVQRALGDTWSLLLRGQYFDRLLMSELPFTYNAYTVQRFDKPYGLVTLGLTARY